MFVDDLSGSLSWIQKIVLKLLLLSFPCDVKFPSLVNWGAWRVVCGIFG